MVLPRNDLVKHVRYDPTLFPGNRFFFWGIIFIGLVHIFLMYNIVRDTYIISKYSPMSSDVEKFDGRINVCLWKVQVKHVFI